MDLNNIDNQNQSLSIKQISQKLKIPKSTLRFWEKEFEGIIVPERTKGGQRRYNYEHINILLGIKKLRDKDMNLSEIKSKFKKKSRRNYSKSNSINIFTERLTELIKSEVLNFLEKSKDN